MSPSSSGGNGNGGGGLAIPSTINFGVSIGHIPVRMKVLHDPGTFLPIGDAAHRALDQDTGQTLWKFKTGSAINSPPITYTHQRRQFVTVLSGVGGAVNRRMKGYDLIPTGGSVTTFALIPD